MIVRALGLSGTPLVRGCRKIGRLGTSPTGQGPAEEEQQRGAWAAVRAGGQEDSLPENGELPGGSDPLLDPKTDCPNQGTLESEKKAL